MATSGTLKTNTDYDSYFWVKWSQNGNQDVLNNRTQIAWSCGVYCGHTFYSNAIKMSAVTINGTKVYSGGTYSNYSKGDHTIASGTMWINHSSDGTKTFSISSFTGWLYSSYNYSSNGGSYTLTTIPRKATITSVSDFTDVDNPSFTFSNPGGFTMNVWLEPNPVGDHLCVRNNIPNTGSYTWELTEEERNILRSKCAGEKCTIRVGLYSKVGSTTEADFKDKTYTMTANDATKPTVTMEVHVNNGLLPGNFDDHYIQGKSKAVVILSAEGKFNADIKSYSVVIDGKTYSPNSLDNPIEITSDVIQGKGDVYVVGYAKDSRKITGSNEQKITVIPYSKPLVVPIGNDNAILCYRSDGNGKRVGNSTSVWIKAQRSYSIQGMNQCALEWRRKLVTEEWNNSHGWNVLLSKEATTDEYNALIPSTVFDLKKSYTVQIRAIDDIGEYDIKTFEIPTQDVALHLGAGGKNVSIGTYCDYSKEYTFYSDWDAYFDKDVYVGVNKISDFPIEQDTSGIWTYKKWNSGEVELWGLATLDKFGDVRHIYTNEPLPFPFTEQPITTMTIYEAESATYLQGEIVLSNSYTLGATTIRLSMIRGSGGLASGNKAQVNVHIKGRYK